MMAGKEGYLLLTLVCVWDSNCIDRMRIGWKDDHWAARIASYLGHGWYVVPVSWSIGILNWTWIKLHLMVLWSSASEPSIRSPLVSRDTRSRVTLHHHHSKTLQSVCNP
ncbi:hypothetical protein B0H66DRAFT_205662 [Apodospora peruviana]|uniref:Uncharacterized protein n=1 Tax=Apodospora peruviana TaxID=516989 RepID=A0AAE0M7T3_9PEZI|nr:hypothetical protein B0H66DRAFT_205662 [Apodospora peruviana]